MSCRSTAASRYLSVLLTAVLLAVGACGKKGEPRPPLKIVPTATSDLAFLQQGEVLTLRMSYPNSTTAGLPLPGLDAVELWEMQLPLTDPDQWPQIDRRQFETAAAKRLVVAGAELLSATQGERIVTRLPLPSDHDPLRLHVFGVRTVATGGEASVFSNLVRLVLTDAPAPPEQLELQAGAEAVRLSWAEVPDVEGYFVYRRLAATRAYGEPLVFVRTARTQYRDESARLGERYIYTVTAVASREPRRESNFGVEAEIHHEDRYPPPPPAELLPLAQPGAVQLVWRPSPADDLGGYFVFRADPGASDFRRLNTEPLEEPRFLDRGLTSGLRFRYRVTAIDASGNEGQPTVEIEVAVP